jgi:hypothetical protein
MAFLEDDLGRGDQFIRLEWLCGAVTICGKRRSLGWHAKNPYRHCSAAAVATVPDSLSVRKTGTSIWTLTDTEVH